MFIIFMKFPFNKPLVSVSVFGRQGGQSDSGMGLSSDNMQTLKRLESLAGRPLSIMALAYVHLPSSAPAHTDGQAVQHTLG